MIIIHGENTSGSYARLTALLESFSKNNRQILSFNAGEISLTNIEQALSPTDLFGSEIVLVLNNLFSGTKSKQKELLKKVLVSKTNKPIIIYETKEISASSLKSYNQVQIEVFKVSPQIFKFVESLSPGKPSIVQFDRLTKDTEQEFIFAMIVRQIRILITAKTNPSMLKTAPFIKSKLLNQAGQFSLDKLLDLHRRLYLIDRQIKLGETPLNLEPLLFGLLASL